MRVGQNQLQRAPLVGPWWRLRLPMRETRVRPLIQAPRSSRVHAPETPLHRQRERLLRREACADCSESSPCSLQLEESLAAAKTSTAKTKQTIFIEVQDWKW